MNNKVIIPLLFGIIILVIFVLFHNSYMVEYGSRLQYADLKPFKDVWQEKDKLTGKTNKQVMYDMMRNTNTVLAHADIKPIIMFGTLLGHMRHNDLIPWDDDVDICVADEDMDKILGLQEFARYGLQAKFIPKLGLIKIFDPKREIVPLWGCSWPFIDIYGYTVENDKVMMRDSYSNTVVDVKDMLPLRNSIFAKQIPVFIPKNPEQILDAVYGNDWKDQCMSSSWNHRSEKIIPKKYKTFCENATNKIDKDILDHVYVINLDRRPDRWEKAKNRLNSIGINPKRWRAIDGKQDPKYQKYKGNSKISPSEAACFDSHVTLWKYLYDNNIPSALILEDDIIIPHDLTIDNILSDIQSSGGFDIFFVGHIYSSLDKFTNTPAKIGTALGLHAYIINRKTIEKILPMTEQKKVPIDVITQDYCNNNLCFLSRHHDIDGNTAPCTGLIHQDFSIDSDLETERIARRIGL